MTNFDDPWKEALDLYFRLCLAFLFPRLHDLIDWSRGYEVLDKELQRLGPASRKRTRFADKLFKVWLKSGEETWILVHVEVQSQKEAGFTLRMFEYSYRIFDRYHREVLSLAILGDDDPTWRPRRFGFGKAGCRHYLKFPIVKLLDYSERMDELESSTNPFAALVLAHLKALETRKNPAERATWKTAVIKSLYHRGWTREDVERMFRFIDMMMQLPEEWNTIWWDQIEAFEEEKKMPYITSVERIGIKKGIEEGEKKGLLEGIEAILDVRYGKKGVALMRGIRRLEDLSLLKAILEKSKTVSSLNDLKQLWI